MKRMPVELWTFLAARWTAELGPAVLEAVARREVLDETGVAITVDLRYVCSASFRTEDGHAVINVVFAATTTDAPPAIPQKCRLRSGFRSLKS
jgi:ADP-ribose pyrophosphatase YjhB (NUDIX family)